ncbi:MAG: GNAT family N-acetyltransferase [Oscillospiraceae bacterium]|nr:GNAT family N-acetyltransferase [Oscillospiraceae bacterium]
MSDVLIRDIDEQDLPALKALIVEAFGDGWNLRRFDQESAVFGALLDVYLSIFLNSSTFGRVAEVEGKVIGAVLAAAKGDVERFRLFQKDIAPNALTLLSAPEAERVDMVTHLATSFQTIGSLLEDKLDDYDGSLEFIAVSKQSQGLGIGKALWREAAAYLESKHVNSIYLISDSACNVGFYEHKGFSRVASKEAVYAYTTGQKRFDIFVYEYHL